MTDEPIIPKLSLADAYALSKLVRKLRKKTEVRDIANSILAEQPVSLGHAEQVLRNELASASLGRWKECEVAALLLPDVATDAAGRKLAGKALWKVLAENSNVRTTPGFWKWSCCCLLAVPVHFIFWVILSVVAYKDVRVNRVRAAAAKALGRMKEARAVPELARAAREHLEEIQGLVSVNIRKAAAEALPGAVSGLTPEHYGGFEPEDLKAICALIRRDQSPEMLATVLDALDVIGDGRCADSVGRFKWGKLSGQLESRAQEVHEMLLARRKAEQLAATLLRPAANPEAPSEILLRPAMGVSDVDPLLLLRPAEPNEETQEQRSNSNE